MKRITALLLTAILLLSLAACSGKGTWQEQYDLGMRYLNEGNYQEAIIAFTAAIEIDEKRPEGYEGRGRAYVLSGETDENLNAAKSDFEKALELDPSYVDAWLDLADIYIRLGDFDKAYEILREALEKTGNDPSVADKIAEMERGTIVDSSDHVRRNSSYNTNGQLESYTLYEYDEQGCRCGWENWSYIDYRESGKEVVLDEPYLANYARVTFNSQDLPERTQFYEADGTPAEYDTFVYNDLGLKVEQHRYKADGTKDCYFLFYYNDNNQEVRYEGYYADGTMYSYWISEYDSDGNFVKETHYDADGTIQGYASNE